MKNTDRDIVQVSRTMTGVAEQRRPALIFLGLATASLAALLLLPPILQDQSYHSFANERTLLGIPNFWNVVSNLPFIAVGAVGLRQFYRDPATLVLFLGVFLTGFGSSYYHWNPNDETLFWDRLPMTLCFMAILAVVVEERVNTRFGRALLWPSWPQGYSV
jgi:ABC-type branched-subunit amino acid transport system permease subunit